MEVFRLSDPFVLLIIIVDHEPFGEINVGGVVEAALHDLLDGFHVLFVLNPLFFIQYDQLGVQDLKYPDGFRVTDLVHLPLVFNNEEVRCWIDLDESKHSEDFHSRTG